MNKKILKTDQAKFKGIWKLTFTDVWTGEIVRVSTYENIMPNIGLNAIADQLAGEETYDVAGTYIAVGTDATAPASTDTTLGSELDRVAISTGTTASNVATIRGFFNSSEGNGTLKEMGLFGDGSATEATASADTGILYSHVAINETKSAGETLTCEFQITVTSI